GFSGPLSRSSAAARIWAVKLIRHGALPDILGPPPALIGRLFKTFAVNYGCNRKRPLAHGTPQGGGGTECEAVRCGRAGCQGVGRLRCDLAAPTRNKPSSLSSSTAVEHVADTAERAADLAKTRPAPTERYSKQSPTLGLVSYC